LAEGVEELLTVLYNMIQDSFTLPFVRAKCVLDRERAMELIEEINVLLPSDLEQARKIVNAKNEIIGNAKLEAEAIKRQAEERARNMVSKEEITMTARQKANDMLAAAESKAREIRIATNQYVDDALKRTEDALTEALNEVRNSRNKFKSAAK
jgi:vacuolar-type H+-ATPase subunit E/Vma4